MSERGNTINYSTFQEEIYRLKGFKLTSYKDGRMKRRITTLMQKRGLSDFKDYLQLLKREEIVFAEMLDYITINTSHFFRNSESFSYLRSHVVPSIMVDNRQLKIWSAACSNGAEPYSMAILLAEHFPRVRFSLLATDINPEILELARRGSYKPGLLREVDPELVKRYFREENGRYTVKDSIRSPITFRCQDLFRAHYGCGYHLILCRNLFIYLKARAKRDLLQRFFQALDPGGVLFTGRAESVLDYSALGFAKLAPCFYRKEA